IESIAPGSELPARFLLSCLVLLDLRHRYVRLLSEFTLKQACMLSAGSQLLDEHGTERDGPGDRLCRAHDRNVLPCGASAAGPRFFVLLDIAPGESHCSVGW
ncbi:MAG: hypothetical protein WAL72_15865, partial [Streptosporangiaceae bacterium]